ncbi:DUF350 domain-containing protein [Terasakiella sp. A23]|uniref:DUF350 domain-containing protein n=1 Tax=Terasakiella sp. FCG-A23 TaxID=3080561 RepID=UPI002954E7FF|nr:DUF350 domain-containing protein [Terasakiella sp. A23]MDV7339914.1 DUF350 domain-containing protein [Terasakiella sp. A23]
MNWMEIATYVGQVAAFVGVYGVIFLAGKLFKDILTPYSLLEQQVKKDNPAVGVSVAGYFFATAIIFVGVLSGPSNGFIDDILTVAKYSVLGLVFLNLSRICLDKLIFPKFCDNTEITEEQNIALGTVRGCAYIATGLIAAGSLNGQGGDIFTACAFFVLGQAVLLVFSRFYDWITPYCLHQEIDDRNLSAGIAFGGMLIALGIIIGRAVMGNFYGWTENLLIFAEMAVAGIILLFVVRWIMDRLILTGHDLNEEISKDKNVAAGFAEMSIAVSFALVLAALV